MPVGLRSSSRIMMKANSNKEQPARESSLPVREGNQPAIYSSLSVIREENEETISAVGESRSTISAKDLIQLRANTYTNITTEQGKKTYKCNYCVNFFHLFPDLKLHIRNNHLEGGSKHRRLPHQISNQSTDQNEALNNMLRKKPPSSQQLQDFQEQNAEFLCLLCKSTYPSKSSALQHSVTKKHLRAKENNTEATQQDENEKLKLELEEKDAEITSLRNNVINNERILKDENEKLKLELEEKDAEITSLRNNVINNERILKRAARRTPQTSVTP